MIDGIKIDCIGLNPSKWLENPKLKFRVDIDPQTGEMLNGTQTAVFRGLVFTITEPKKANAAPYCSVRGSLHRYAHGGKNNALDFDFEALQNTIAELHNFFGIDPARAHLRNLEFGVNIQTPCTPKELFKNMVCLGGHEWGILKVSGKILGRCIPKNRYTFKVYDKGRAARTGDKNLIRFEVAVKKMAHLAKYEIRTLADLNDPAKVCPLLGLLLGQWSQVIYYNKDINFKQMTKFKQKKILYYAAPRNWTEFNKVQRTRAKKQFAALMDKYGNGNPEYKKIGQLLAEKWQQLSPKNCIPFNRVFEAMRSQKLYTFSPLEYTVKKYTLNTQKETPKNQPKKGHPEQSKKEATHHPPTDPPPTPETKTNKPAKTCKVCKVDISHKKPAAKYCSKQCNNKASGRRRTERERKRRQKEIPVLERFKNKLSKSDLKMAITYKANGHAYTDFLSQSEIQAPRDWINAIAAIRIEPTTPKGKPTILTHTRARQLVRAITQANQLNCKYEPTKNKRTESPSSNHAPSGLQSGRNCPSLRPQPPHG